MTDFYKQSGVDVDKTDNLVKAISSHVNGIGGYGGLYPFGRNYLVGTTDGVGTKLLLAREYNMLEGVGIDCVAMCVNDIVCTGATPLFFLDYFAASNVNEKEYVTVISSIKKGCEDANVALIGGETAELPGMFGNNNFDIAGFCTGVVKKRKLIDGSKIERLDAIIGLPSNGFHSNGYSLVRKWFDPRKHEKYLKEILQPTEIYSNIIVDLLDKVGNKVRGLVHVTGGGRSNIDRILPKGMRANFFDFNFPARPEIFNIIQTEQKISNREMNTVFNNGVGMYIIVANKYKDQIINTLLDFEVPSYEIGFVH